MLFDATTRDTFLNIFAGAPERQLQPGATLLHAGAAATHVYNIVEGTLMVSRIGNDGRRQVMSFLFPDNFIGLTTERYFFSVQAVTAARIVSRPRRLLEERLEQDPEAGRAFLNMVYRVLENSMDLVYSLGQRTAVERVAVFLLYLRNRRRIAEGLADTDPGLQLIDLPMSRQDIADFLGLKKETVSRSFTTLDQRQLISRPDNSHAFIIDLQGLRDLAGIQDFSSPLRPPPLTSG
ncbi:MAG: helix-turn-helix domain-containing protein [Gammaproteobacteria bacterium]|jgi:CRP/FNR family transcriptional regulator|nr:helix-turn-helix domain-containing protein [Gammaproteobacteria bacterium]